MRDIGWIKESVFYHIYPLGAFDCPRENRGEETAGHRILTLIDWIPHLNGRPGRRGHRRRLRRLGRHGADR